ncbi:MAG: hypothetical protein ACQEXQ_02855 [Bacillota bacterium]
MKPNREWENPHVAQKNRYPMHEPYGVYETVEQALSGDRRTSKRTMLKRLVEIQVVFVSGCCNR